jgi:hypothetical protein
MSLKTEGFIKPLALKALYFVSLFKVRNQKSFKMLLTMVESYSTEPKGSRWVGVVLSSRAEWNGR